MSIHLRLAQWSKYAKKHLTPDWYAALVTAAYADGAAGGPPKDRTWWLYFGAIAPEKFQSVEILVEKT